MAEIRNLNGALHSRFSSDVRHDFRLRDERDGRAPVQRVAAGQGGHEERHEAELERLHVAVHLNEEGELLEMGDEQEIGDGGTHEFSKVRDVS